MATSEWLKEMRQAAGAAQGVNYGPSATASSRPRDDAAAGQAAAPATGEKPTGQPMSAPQRPQRAFTAPTDAARDYRAMYGALFRFHERHSPPSLGNDDGAVYWAATTDDMTETAQQFGNDPFMIGLLCVVFEELETEYKTMRQRAGA